VNPIEQLASDAVHGVENALHGRDAALARRAARQQAAAPAASSSSSQPEVPVSTLGTDLHRIEGVLAAFGENAVDILEAVAANPETLALVVAGANVAGLPLQPGTITTAANTLKAIGATWSAAQQAAQAPAQTAPAAPDGTAQPAAAM